jgi:hypothetical protein
MGQTKARWAWRPKKPLPTFAFVPDLKKLAANSRKCRPKTKKHLYKQVLFKN